MRDPKFGCGVSSWFPSKPIKIVGQCLERCPFIPGRSSGRVRYVLGQSGLHLEVLSKSACEFLNTDTHSWNSWALYVSGKSCLVANTRIV